jgi:hypothetical protein
MYARIVSTQILIHSTGSTLTSQVLTHQVGDLVFVLLPLFIQGAHGHIDRVIVQYDVAYYNNYQ